LSSFVSHRWTRGARSCDAVNLGSRCQMSRSNLPNSST